MSTNPPAPNSAVAGSLPDRLSFPEAPLTEAEKTPRKRTTGERLFDGAVYAGIAGVVTFALSVATMYLTKHSEGKAFFGLSDKSWSQGWKDLGKSLSEAKIWSKIADSRLGKTKLFSFVHNKESLQSFSESTLTTGALNMGGMAMMLPVNYAEHHKKDFVHALNEKFGKPGETEIGDTHVKNEPPQTFGSILTGRVTAVLTVLFSLTVLNSWITKGAQKLVKPDSGPAMKAAAENAMGAVEKWSANLFGKVHNAMAPNAAPERTTFWKRIGEISAIDAIATVAASSILYVSSKFYSRVGSRRDGLKAAAEHGGIGNVKATTATPSPVSAPAEAATHGIDAAKLPAIVPEVAKPAPAPVVHSATADADPTHAPAAEATPLTARIAPRASYMAEATKPAAEHAELAR